MMAAEVGRWLLVLGLAFGAYQWITRMLTRARKTSWYFENEPGFELRARACNVAALFWLIVFLLPEAVAFAEVPFTEPVRWLGNAMILLGAIQAFASQYCLGRNWSGRVGLREEHTLTTHGVYSVVRHPMYGSFILGLAGLFLSQGNVLLLAAVPYLGLTVERYKQEEALMEQTFGNEFREWRSRSWRFVPYVF